MPNTKYLCYNCGNHLTSRPSKCGLSVVLNKMFPELVDSPVSRVPIFGVTGALGYHTFNFSKSHDETNINEMPERAIGFDLKQYLFPPLDAKKVWTEEEKREFKRKREMEQRNERSHLGLLRLMKLMRLWARQVQSRRILYERNRRSKAYHSWDGDDDTDYYADSSDNHYSSEDDDSSSDEEDVSDSSIDHDSSDDEYNSDDGASSEDDDSSNNDESTNYNEDKGEYYYDYEGEDMEELEEKLNARAAKVDARNHSTMQFIREQEEQLAGRDLCDNKSNPICCEGMRQIEPELDEKMGLEEGESGWRRHRREVGDLFFRTWI